MGSHNTEFTDSVCTQKWIMEKSEQTGTGRLREEGEIKLDEAIEEQKGPDEVYDESGNKIEVKKKLEAKDVKKMKDHAKKKNLADEEVWELSDKLAELKEMLT